MRWKRFGRPQYFEWALTFAGGQPRFWITQIADVDPKLDMMEFGNLENAVFLGHSVVGTGEKRCKGVAYCFNPLAIEDLARFNAGHENYLLLYSSWLTTHDYKGAARRLPFADIGNASVLLEQQKAAHVTGGPLSHFGGALDMARKFFAVLALPDDLDDQRLVALLKRNYERLKASARKVGELTVYDVPVRVIASERQNLLAVLLDE